MDRPSESVPMKAERVEPAREQQPTPRRVVAAPGARRTAAAADPHGRPSSDAAMHLQRTLGNRAAERLLRPGRAARLPADLADDLARHAGTPLPEIAIHADADANAAARALDARAFTVGATIHFGAGEYDPAASAGRHLIAHEVAHVLQQRGAAAVVQPKRALGEPGDPAELAADAFADAFVAGRSHPVPARADVAAIARAPRSGPRTSKTPTPRSVPVGGGIRADFGPVLVNGREVNVSLRMSLHGKAVGVDVDRLPPAPEHLPRGATDPGPDTALASLRATARAAAVVVTGSELRVEVCGQPLQIVLASEQTATRSVLSTHAAGKSTLITPDVIFTGSLDAELITTVVGADPLQSRAEGSTAALSRVAFLGQDARLVDTDKQRHNVAAADPAAIAEVLAIKTVLAQAEVSLREDIVAEAIKKTVAAESERPARKRRAPEEVERAGHAAGDKALARTAFASAQFADSIGTTGAALRLLEWMRPWFGSDARTVAHFQGMRRVRGQDNLLVHGSLATRLEAVQSEMVAAYPDLGKRAYPECSVGWSFRGEVQVGTNQGHKHMHKIGMAVDFDAYNLPMMNPGVTRALVKAVTGRSNALFLAPETGSGQRDWTRYGERRAMIRSLERPPASPDKQRAQEEFLRDLGDAIDATADASMTLRASLDQNGGLARFKRLREDWADANAIAEPERRAAETAKLDAAITEFIQPWLTKIEQYRAELHARARTEHQVDLDRQAPDIKPLQISNKSLQALATRLARKPGSKRSPLETRLVAEAAIRLGEPVSDPPTAAEVAALAKATAEALDAGKGELDRRKRAQDIAADHWFAGDLIKKLLTDRVYLFGTPGKTRTVDEHGDPVRTWSRSVDQPGAGQMLERGWFRVAEPGTTRGTPSKEFMLAMARHGFELGGSWTSSDSMHYEVAV